MAIYPKRGGVYRLGIDPVSGAETEIYAVVVQNNVGNEYAPTVIAAQVEPGRQSSFDLEVTIPAQAGGMPEDGVIRADRLFTADKALFSDKTGALPAGITAELNEALSISIGLTEF